MSEMDRHGETGQQPAASERHKERVMKLKDFLQLLKDLEADETYELFLSVGDLDEVKAEAVAIQNGRIFIVSSENPRPCEAMKRLAIEELQLPHRD